MMAIPANGPRPRPHPGSQPLPVASGLTATLLCSTMQGALCPSQTDRRKGDGQTDAVNHVTGCGGWDVPVVWLSFNGATEFPVEAPLPELLGGIILPWVRGRGGCLEEG